MDITHAKKQIEINQIRSYAVVTHNDFIRNTANALTVVEKKIWAYGISKIKKNDIEVGIQTINMNELIKVFGITDAGKNYQMIKDGFKSIKDKSAWFLKSDNLLTTVGFYKKVTLNQDTLEAYIEYDDDIKSYLLNLKDHFTAFSLANILKMKSTYSFDLYEILKSYQNLKEPMYSTVEFTIAHLKKLLNVEKISSYERFGNFKARVLDAAINEINELTDLDVTYKLDKKGRSYEKIRFKITKREFMESYEAQKKVFEE